MTQILRKLAYVLFFTACAISVFDVCESPGSYPYIASSRLSANDLEFMLILEKQIISLREFSFSEKELRFPERILGGSNPKGNANSDLRHSTTQNPDPKTFIELGSSGISAFVPNSWTPEPVVAFGEGFRSFVSPDGTSQIFLGSVSQDLESKKTLVDAMIMFMRRSVAPEDLKISPVAHSISELDASVGLSTAIFGTKATTSSTGRIFVIVSAKGLEPDAPNGVVLARFETARDAWLSATLRSFRVAEENLSTNQ